MFPPTCLSGSASLWYRLVNPVWFFVIGLANQIHFYRTSPSDTLRLLGIGHLSISFVRTQSQLTAKPIAQVKSWALNTLRGGGISHVKRALGGQSGNHIERKSNPGHI